MPEGSDLKAQQSKQYKKEFWFPGNHTSIDPFKVTLSKGSWKWYFTKWHQTLENNLVEVRSWIHDNIQVNS